MARQGGILKIKGTIGDITFFKTRDGYRVKEKSGVDGDRIATDPKFQRTRENGAEFGESALASKILRSAIRAMARLILKVEAMTDYARGITTNVGVVSAGGPGSTDERHAAAVRDPEILLGEDFVDRPAREAEDDVHLLPAVQDLEEPVLGRLDALEPVGRQPLRGRGGVLGGPAARHDLGPGQPRGLDDDLEQHGGQDQQRLVGRRGRVVQGGIVSGRRRSGGHRQPFRVTALGGPEVCVPRGGRRHPT